MKTRIYENFNVTIDIGDSCNANCGFCVMNLRGRNDKTVSDKYLKDLDSRLGYIRQMNPSLSITGGEPSKFPLIHEVLDIVKKHNFRKVVFTTNASGLFDYKEEMLLDKIIEVVDHLNISRAATDEEMNQKIMKFDRYRQDYVSNKKIELISRYVEDTKVEIRMSTILHKGAIYNSDTMMEHIKFYESLGIKQIVFREMMRYDNTNSKEVSEYYSENRVTVDSFDIPEELKLDHKRSGYYYDVDSYKYKGMKVSTEVADLGKLDTAREDTIYELIIHPNGNMNSTWNDSAKQLHQGIENLELVGRDIETVNY